MKRQIRKTCMLYPQERMIIKVSHYMYLEHAMSVLRSSRKADYIIDNI